MQHKTYRVLNKEIKETKQGKPYISLVLVENDNSKQTLDGKIWSDQFQKLKNIFKSGDLISVTQGKIDSYNNKTQLIIENIEVVEEGKWGYSTEEATIFLSKIIDITNKNITSEDLQQITLGVLDFYSQKANFLLAPAAKSHHHNYPGGLLKHTLELLTLALSIKDSDLYPNINWDIVLGACILHDLGKVDDYIIKNGEIETTENIYLTGHLVSTPLIIYTIAKSYKLEESKLFKELLHAVIAHHGKKEYGSPQKPSTKESWLVHLVDMISSQLA